ncbi:MAG: glycosyltransferase [Bacteroidales bacterium]|nr:glycosyltransferase [Bacteroidales bacterium]MBN2756591.1 glycosyltransferase [Bacteroidales bacterium]
MDCFSNFSALEISLLAVIIVSLIIQLFYYFFFYLRIEFYKRKTEKNTQFPVSIVICAKDEAENLKNFLPLVLNQKYPEFEVIVVNDGSEDETADILKLLKNDYGNLYVTTIPSDTKFKHGKKLAVSIGLKAAKNDWVLLTDADCKPESENWLSYMQENFVDKTEIVISYGAYEPSKGFLNKLIRFDTMFIALQYFTFAMARIPYMGVGRNLAYKKSLFFENRGFSNHLHLESGDDDLFVNENANNENVKIELRPETFTQSKAEKKFKDWYYQKKRHLTTGKYYKFKHKVLLGLEVFSRELFYISFIFALIYCDHKLFLIPLFLIRMITQLTVLYFASKKLNEKNIFYLGIIFDFIIPIINFIVIFSNTIKRKRKK